MKLKSGFSKFIHSKLLLYAVFSLSVIVFLGNLLTGNFDIVVYYVVISGLTSFFTNNMTIVLFIPLLFVILYTHFIKSKMFKMKEGNQNMNPNSNNTEEEKIDELKKNNDANTVPSSQDSLPVVPVTVSEDSTTQEGTFKNGR